MSSSAWARGRGPVVFALACAWMAASIRTAGAQNHAPLAPASGGASVTYTPMVRPGATPSSPAAAAPAPARVAPPPAVAVPRVPASVAAPAAAPLPPPGYAPSSTYPGAAPPSLPPGWFAPAPDRFAAPAYAPVPVPAVDPGAWPPAASLPPPPAPGAPVATAAATVRPRGAPVHRWFGLGLDLGLPDGANLALALSPARWARLTVAAGTNSASLAYRGGLTLVPVGWGPSFSFEVGHCNMAPTNDVIRTFFSAPAWVKPYVQQFGYTYVNAHLGFELPLGGLVVFLRGGYSYIMGTLRAPDSVVVDSTTNTSVTIARDGEVNASTLSAKLGLLYMFGGS